MPTYSASGYPTAVIMRSSRTLLVEGPDDKATITRLVLELRNRNQTKSANLVIDTAEDIPDATGGNRQRVEAMHATVTGSSKFASLVDREFRNFDLIAVRDLTPVHVEIPTNLFWTRGHSLENYLSDVDIFVASLEENVPEHLPLDYRRHLQASFPSILRNCASMSLAANTIGRLDRVQKVSGLDHWIVQPDGSVLLDLTRVRTILVARGIALAECSQFEIEFNRCLIQLTASDLSLSRWICHGHLAECHIWCAIAATLRHYGMDTSIATKVGWGSREALVRVSRGAWSEQCAAGLGDPPLALIQWLCA